MSTTADRPPGRWRRASAWMSNHPRWVGSAYVVIGVAWIGADLPGHEADRLMFPVLFTVAGVSLFGRATLKVEGATLTVPNRVWGGRQIAGGDIEAVETPTSVWSVDASWVVLHDGERLMLRGADRDRAPRIANELAVAVVGLSTGSTPRPAGASRQYRGKPS